MAGERVEWMVVQGVMCKMVMPFPVYHDSGCNGKYQDQYQECASDHQDQQEVHLRLDLYLP